MEDNGLNRCVRRKDGLILRREQKHLPDASNVLRTLVGRGHLVRLSRGAYLEAAVLRGLQPWQRYDLEARALGEATGRVLAGYSAAAVWQLWRYEPTPAGHEVYRNGGGRKLAASPQFRQVHYTLAAKDVTGRHLKATTVERTLVDLTRLHGFGAGFVAACSALRQKLVTRESLAAHDIRGEGGAGSLAAPRREGDGEGAVGAGGGVPGAVGVLR